MLASRVTASQREMSELHLVGEDRSPWGGAESTEKSCCGDG